MPGLNGGGGRSTTLPQRNDLEEPMKIARFVVLSMVLAVIASVAAAAAERKLSGSELLRAERCAGSYDCDEDGSWATGGSGGPTMETRAELRLPLVRDCVAQGTDAKAERSCPVLSTNKASR
jgi:hypothetical protein